MRTFLLILAACNASIAAAAPPKLDYLSPAGAGPGEARTVTAAGSFSKWPPQVWVDREGISVVANSKKGKLDVSVGPQAAGVYFIRLHDAEGASSVRPFVIDSLPSIEEVEPNNSIADAQAIEGNAVIDGVLHKSGEVDMFAVPLKKGQTLVASLLANNLLGSPMDAVMQIAGPEGFVLAQNDDSVGTDPRVIFEAPGDGVYRVGLFAFPSTPNSTINFSGAGSYVYRLTLTTGGFVDHCFPLAYSGEKDQAFQLHGWNLPTTVVELEAAGGESRQFIAHPEIASFVEIVHSKVPVLDGALESTDAPISLPIVISSRIAAAGEADSYVFDAGKGQVIDCRIESDALGYLLDPVLTLDDDAGKQLAEVDDTSGRRDGQLIHTIPADGRYRLTVRDRYGDGGLRYAYRLTIDDSNSGFDLTVASDSFVVKSGNKLSIPVAVARQKGCREEIEITVQGLPENLTAAVVKSEPKSDSSKSVSVEISGKAVPFSGPITILGTIADQPTRETLAAFPVAESGQMSSAIWLTVTKP